MKPQCAQPEYIRQRKRFRDIYGYRVQHHVNLSLRFPALVPSVQMQRQKTLVSTSQPTSHSGVILYDFSRSARIFSPLARAASMSPTM